MVPTVGVDCEFVCRKLVRDLGFGDWGLEFEVSVSGCKGSKFRV